MKKIIFDTDVLIEYLRGNESVRSHIRELVSTNNIIACTPVSDAEIYKGLRSHEREKTKEALGSFECVTIDREVGRRAGEYLRSFTKSHGVELPDALIAAAAKVHRFTLCTFNWKHYPMTDVDRYVIGR